MDIQRPLYWHQGLFLQPQHFQLQDLVFQSQLLPMQRLLAPHFWGVRDLKIEAAALGIHSFSVAGGRFLFPDGTYVEFPGNARLEPRSFDDAWLDGGKPLEVYLGLKKWNASGENVTVLESDDALADIATRFVTSPDPEDTHDLHSGGPDGQVKRLSHALKIFWGSEKDHLGDYDLIPVAQLERTGGSVGLALRFIPPCVSLSGSDTLVKLVREIGDQLQSRSRQLEEHKSQRGIHTAEFGSRDMVYLLALRSINRYVPSYLHYLDAPDMHPWHMYGILRQIVGDLSCFSEKINVLGEDPDDESLSLPSYDHADLWCCFSIAQALIMRMLDNITAGPDYIVKLERQANAYTADLKPTIFDGNNRFYLALKTPDDPRTAIAAMDTVVKLSSRSQIDRLVSHALPGVPMLHLTQPPQELPRRRNVIYFAIDSQHEQWVYVKKEKAVALAWDGSPEGVQLELMVTAR